VETDVCVVGGGPAGIMLGLLLARRGIDVVVVEKHRDFLRDFRGDTIHPSTLDVLDDLDLAEAVAKLPGRKVRELTMTFADGTRRLADFGRLRVRHPYLLFVPQWDLLEMLAAAAAASPEFTLLRSREAVRLLRDDGTVRGAVVRGPDGPVEIHARLTVGADGRHSTVRAELGLPRRTFGAPMDVLWFRLPRRPDDGAGLLSHVDAGRMLVLIDRGDYWQTAFLIPKGGYDAVRSAGIDALRRTVAGLAPGLADRVDALAGWDDVAFLAVQVDRLLRWYAPGALLIGDAAHAMSPVGGVGINLAIQDAVAAARLLAEPLRAGEVTEADLARLQRRRTPPTVGTQLLQRFIQRAMIGRVLAADRPLPAPVAMKLVSRVPVLAALPARVIGVGIRPERP
jgi:2-polyprenyl-6-methoxyphenol hydroxylase-like FAD-dependent oxidoreductase